MLVLIQPVQYTLPGGDAVVVPVLERCEMDAALQLAKGEHPTLPPLRLGVTLPKLRFFISPARLHRVMRILQAALPSALLVLFDFHVPQSEATWDTYVL